MEANIGVIVLGRRKDESAVNITIGGRFEQVAFAVSHAIIKGIDTLVGISQMGVVAVHFEERRIVSFYNLIDFFAVFDGFNDFLDVFLAEFEIGPIFGTVGGNGVDHGYFQSGGIVVDWIGINLSEAGIAAKYRSDEGEGRKEGFHGKRILCIGFQT